MTTWKDRERHAIIEALRACHGFQNAAAASLGMSPRVMNYKVKLYGIDWRKYRPEVKGPDPELTLGAFVQAIVDEAWRHLQNS